eukprot:gnl/Hemi2/36_TR8_c0_g1_i1.p1 gnl/Hemi2/36_TR8_c0_g1~~gnl/Hemi2/36_TR8_c0_g1_i1.p1  ORF type:complete len:310 (-),score=65.13 gnl/Hemi2/36_TR8_c0_g1_i1:228-1157(-)
MRGGVALSELLAVAAVVVVLLLATQPCRASGVKVLFDPVKEGVSEECDEVPCCVLPCNNRGYALRPRLTITQEDIEKLRITNNLFLALYEVSPREDPLLTMEDPTELLEKPDNWKRVKQLLWSHVYPSMFESAAKPLDSEPVTLRWAEYKTADGWEATMDDQDHVTVTGTPPSTDVWYRYYLCSPPVEMSVFTRFVPGCWEVGASLPFRLSLEAAHGQMKFERTIRHQWAFREQERQASLKRHAALVREQQRQRMAELRSHQSVAQDRTRGVGMEEEDGSDLDSDDDPQQWQQPPGRKQHRAPHKRTVV